MGEILICCDAVWGKQRFCASVPVLKPLKYVRPGLIVAVKARRRYVQCIAVFLPQ